MTAKPIYIVRHGRYERSSGSLSELGREVDAIGALHELLLRGLGGASLVLSSDIPRAIQTAEIIADGLQAQVLPSKRIAEGSEMTVGIRNLDDFIAKALIEAGAGAEQEASLVVVAHAPLVAAVGGDFSLSAGNDTRYGEVVEYVPGSWNNTGFSPAYESGIERRLSA